MGLRCITADFKTDANSQLTKYSYNDSLKRLTDIYDPPSSQNSNVIPHTSYQYTDGSQSSITQINPIGVTSVDSFDGMGHKVKHELTTGSTAEYIDTVYTGTGKVYSTTNPYRNYTETTYGKTTFSYDVLGRKVAESHTDGTSHNWVYIGNLSLESDEATHNWARTMDSLGRLSQVRENAQVSTRPIANNTGGVSCGLVCSPAITISGGLVTRYTYDLLDNLQLVNQIGDGINDIPRARSFTYDSLSHLLISTNPETGTICYGQWSGGSVGSGTCQNGYDANGNLISKTDARAITTTYSYDPLNRLTRKTYSDGTVGEGYGYDGKGADGNPLGQPSLNPIGRLSQQSNFVNIASTFSYDPMGRLSQVTQCIPTDCSYDISTSASYDLAGNMVSMTYPDGRTVQNVRDSAGRLSSVNYLSWGTANVNQPYFSELNGYDPAGHLIAGAFGNGVPMSAAYDNRERMINLAYGPTTGPLWSKQYAWTPNSNMQSATDLITGVQRQFAYDNLNRLTSAQDLFSNFAVPSSSNGNTGSTSSNGSSSMETPGIVGAIPQWTNTDDSNLLTDLGTPDSTWYLGNAVVASNSAMAPNGVMGATTVTASSGSPDTFVGAPVSSPADYSLETMTGSVWLRSLSGTQTLNLYITDYEGGNFQIPGMTQVQLNTTWQQFKVTGSVLGNNVTFLTLQIGGGGSVTGGGGFMMWNPMLEDKGRTGSSVTNFAPNSQLMTAATWVSSQGTVTSNTVAAPDGTNTGATLTANTGSTDNWVVDTVANPAPLSGIPMTGSVWLRVPSGTQQISVNLDEIGSTGFNTIGNTTFTVTTDWQRFQVTGVTQSVLNQLQFQIGGGGSFTNGAVVYAWGAQLEMSSSAGPYVATASAPVTMGTSMTNLLTYSQDPTNWSSAAVSVSGNSVSAPDGSLTAAKLTATGVDSLVTVSAPNPYLYEGQTLTASIYLKSESGTPTINLYPYCFVPTGTQYFPPLSVTLSSVWQRFQTTATLPSVCNGLSFQVGGANSFSSGQVIDLWGAQMEIAPQAGPYVATTALPLVTGRTLNNILPNAQIGSGPNWSVMFGSVAVNSAAAPDGTNTATIFTSFSSSSDSYSALSVPNPSLYDGQTVTTSVYLRAVSGTQNVSLLVINSGNQGWQVASTTTALLTTTWQRFTLTSTLQNGLQSLYLQIGGGGSVSGGQGYEVWGPQFNVGSTPTPYTPTPVTSTVYSTGAVGTLVPNGLNQAYAYDSFGDILQNGSFNTTYNTNNQMYAYPYDAAGNLLSDRIGNIMTWDAESRISSVGGAKYLYDGDGNRVEKQGSSVTDTIYFGGKPIARLSGGQWTDLIYGPTGLLAEVPGTQTASPMYRVTDNLGTDVGSLLANGSFVNRMDHTPFGQVISGSTNDPYFLTGKERDAESGLDYFGARYYGSNMGRFMSPDWADKPEAVPYSSLSDPQTLNLYGYMRNNPLGGADVDGHSGYDEFDLLQNSIDNQKAQQNQAQQQGDSSSTTSASTAVDAAKKAGGVLSTVKKWFGIGKTVADDYGTVKYWTKYYNAIQANYIRDTNESYQGEKGSPNVDLALMNYAQQNIALAGMQAAADANGHFSSVMGSLDKGIIQMQQLNVDAAWKNYVSERTAYFAQQAQQAPQ